MYYQVLEDDAETHLGEVLTKMADYMTQALNGQPIITVGFQMNRKSSAVFLFF